MDPNTIFLRESITQNLRVLVLQNCTVSISPFLIYTVKSFFSNLEVLDVSGSDSLVSDAIILALSLPKLKTLGLSRTTFQADDHFPYVVPKLEVLDLEGTSIDSNTFKIIKCDVQYLVELYVCFTPLSHIDFCLLDENCVPHLKVLCIRRTDMDGVALLVIMGQLSKSLRRICVGNCPKSYPFQEQFPDTVIEENKSADNCEHHLKADYMQDL